MRLLYIYIYSRYILRLLFNIYPDCVVAGYDASTFMIAEIPKFACCHALVGLIPEIPMFYDPYLYVLYFLMHLYIHIHQHTHRQSLMLLSHLDVAREIYLVIKGARYDALACMVPKILEVVSYDALPCLFPDVDGYVALVV